MQTRKTVKNDSINSLNVAERADGKPGLALTLLLVNEDPPSPILHTHLMGRVTR